MDRYILSIDTKALSGQESVEIYDKIGHSLTSSSDIT